MRTEPLKIKSLLSDLSGEDSRLAMVLIDAATVGIALASDPAQPELRKQGARIWSEVRSIASHHLTSEEELMLPWAAEQRRFPRNMINRAKRKIDELRGLARIIDALSFETGSDQAVHKAAKALYSFAARLDDLIAGEERDLFPMIRHALFARP